MASLSIAEREALKDRGCGVKIRHADILSAIEHARRIDDGGIRIYGCERCGCGHVGHDKTAAQTKLLRTNRKIEKGRQALLDPGISPERRNAYQQSVRALISRKAQLEATIRRAGKPLPYADSNGLVLLGKVLIRMGSRLQRIGARCVTKGKSL